MSHAFMFIVGGAVAGAQAATSNSPTAPSVLEVLTEPSDAACPSHDPRKIVVCGQRQPYRLDPSVMEAGRETDSNSRSATSATPSAQAACSASPMGCTKDLGNLDLANVAIVVGTTVARAAKGDDWTTVFRPGGPNEYQLYQQAKRRRDAEAEERVAAELKRKAEAQEREAQATKSQSE